MSKANNDCISGVSDFTLEEMQKAVAYGFWYATESQNNGGVPVGNFLQWVSNQREMTEIPKEWDEFMKQNGYDR